MTRSRTLLAALATGALAVGASATPALAAHESNNRAELSGSGVTGQAIVNYAKGKPTEWTASVNLRGLEPGTYTFQVTGGPQMLEQTVCTVTVRADGGRQGCSDNRTELAGFAGARVLDETGAVVASGTFERRGGARFTAGA